ncbi:hypothetical protein YSA_00031 [Pseudomonas putida ND6]|uniref:Uncharacterized protein n=1 Tax=Pseudomonas putida ND6 TaxID=231023 RepID=I3UMT1_PSEPU|nr:hypothetical protein YSA_00031 [Pseudomonas putida ND6]
MAVLLTRRGGANFSRFKGEMVDAFESIGALRRNRR